MGRMSKQRTAECAEYLNQSAVARMFGVSCGTIRNWSRRSRLFAPAIDGDPFGGREGRCTNRVVRYHRHQVELMRGVLEKRLTLEMAELQWDGWLAGSRN